MLTLYSQICALKPIKTLSIVSFNLIIDDSTSASCLRKKFVCEFNVPVLDKMYLIKTL